MLRQSAMVLFASLAAAALAVPASAQQPASTSVPKKPAYDPNERICEDLSIGTRVNKQRFCGTRAEWEALKQRDRDEVQKAQRPMQCTRIMGKSC